MADTDLNTPVAPVNAPLMGQGNAPAAPKAPPAPQRKRPNVMPAVKQESGQGGREKASKIVADYVMQQSGSQQTVDQVMKILAALIQKKLSRLVQFGNTVFWATQAGRGTIDVHIASLESPKLVARHLQQFYQWCKAKGFNKVTSTITDQQQIGVLKLSGIPYTLKQTQVSDGKKMVPAFNMTVEIK